MKKHQLKTTFFKTIDLLPSKLGYALYHKVQSVLTESFDVKQKANERSFNEIQRILAHNGMDLKGMSLLEIGSGWMPILPYLLHYKGGCSKVYTFDINDHYSNRYIDELNAYYQKQLSTEIELTLDQLHIPDFVEYHPHSNVINSPLPDKVDLIYSRFVLEHVTPTDLVAMHKRFLQEYGSDVLILHLISPSDHRAFSDISISHYDFLQYSQKEWDGIQTKFDYHNRLRLPQYLTLLEEAGMEVIHQEFDTASIGSKKYERFKALKIHSDFAGYTDDELTAGSINLLLRPKAV